MKKLAKLETIEDKPNALTSPDAYRFMNLFFDRKGVIYTHQYNSYNKFVDEDIKKFMEQGDHTFFERITKDHVIKYKFKYENITFRGPILDDTGEPMFPSDAMNRNMTYKGRLFAKVTQYQEITDIATGAINTKIVGEPEKNVPLADIPVMLHSKFCTLSTYYGYDKKECEYNVGCYFIINGAEKVILSQDKMCDNKPLTFIKKDSGVEVYVVQVNSRSYKPHGITQVLNIRMKKDSPMTIKYPYLNEIPVFLLFRALGIESDKDIINYIVPDENDSAMIEKVTLSLNDCRNDKGAKIQSQQDALDFLINKMRVATKKTTYTEVDKNIRVQQRKMHLLDLLKTNLLPHLENNHKIKAMYLGYMITKLLKCVLGRTAPDDRDSYVNKRVDMTGDLLMELFKQHYRKMINECNRYFRKKNASDVTPLNCINQIRPNTIEQGIKASLLTGKWPRRQGVAQMLQRFSYMQFITFFRRVDAPGGDASSSKLTSPRHLHPSSVGFLCCVSTPEHSRVGLNKSLSIVGSVSILQTNQMNIIREYFRKSPHIIDLRDILPKQLKSTTKVFLNGNWFGVTENPVELERDLRQKKLSGTFEGTTSIVHDIDNMELRVYCDGGRLFRPVIRVEDNVIKLTQNIIDKTSINKLYKDKKITSWNEFLIKYPDVIEYIDMEEQPFLMLAATPADVEIERRKMTDSIDQVKNVVSNITENRYDDMTYVKYTHCEIEPALLLGEIPANSPYCNHNEGPRNIFYYSQARQAMGIYASNWRQRNDISYILYHPQKPLVGTRPMKFLYTDIMTASENIVVAIMPFLGLTSSG